MTALPPPFTGGTPAASGLTGSPPPPPFTGGTPAASGLTGSPPPPPSSGGTPAASGLTGSPPPPPSWRGCVVPAELLYDVDRHVWVRLQEDGTAVLGMTDVAQTIGGKVVSISWKQRGKIVKRGRPLAVIESAKWVGPFPSPLTCELLDSNEAIFERDILIANRDPYGEGWLVRIRPIQLEEERAELLDGEAALERYRELIEKEDIRCFRCAD